MDASLALASPLLRYHNLGSCQTSRIHSRQHEMPKRRRCEPETQAIRGPLCGSPAARGPVASIASLRGADENYDSYSSLPPYGVLGHFEGGPEPLTRVAPLMIWHLTSAAYLASDRNHQPEPQMDQSVTAIAS